MSYSDIPAELKAIPQWVAFRNEDIKAAKPTKVPYNSKTGLLASVTDPTTWLSFEEVTKAKFSDLKVVFDADESVNKTGYNGIGFVFTINDPFAFLDLDTTSDPVNLERQLKIFKEFDSYSEISPSGKGLHIIIKGSIPQGRRRSSIEIYSSNRYATMTGNIYNNKPIENRQELLSQLWEQMGGSPTNPTFTGDEKEKYQDTEIYKMGEKAINGQKFKNLFRGDWRAEYQSQSEADFALIDILAFYTQNKNQIIRLFHASALGKRQKAQRKDYIEGMVNKAFDRQLPNIDMEGFKISADNFIQQNVKAAELTEKLNGPVAQLVEKIAHNEIIRNCDIVIPPGLMGEIAKFVYEVSPRPVPQMALAAAIGLMAGICGRAYNISGTGLNLYLLLIAKTGRGKEALALGIDKLMNSIKLTVPSSTEFRGPGIINSGQALSKYFEKTQCFVSVLGEFGIRLSQISADNASSADKQLYWMMLDLYNKSGHGQTFQPSIYSKKEESVGIIEAPAMTILGESTPGNFYKVLNEEMISAGLLPRFLIIEYDGPRVDIINENHYKIEPHFTLIEKLASLTAMVQQIMHAKKVINVSITPDAKKLLDNFDKSTTQIINVENSEVIAELWNRAHMKVLRLSALVAVGVNLADPVVTLDYVKWAMNLIEEDIKLLSQKFDRGEIGITSSSENIQQSDLLEIAKDFVLKDWNEISKYHDNQMLHQSRVIPYAYLSRRLQARSSYRSDRLGATAALKRTIQVLIDGDILREIPRAEMLQKFGTYQKAYMISNLKILREKS